MSFLFLPCLLGFGRDLCINLRLVFRSFIGQTLALGVRFALASNSECSGSSALGTSDSPPLSGSTSRTRCRSSSDIMERD